MPDNKEPQSARMHVHTHTHTTHTYMTHTHTPIHDTHTYTHRPHTYTHTARTHARARTHTHTHKYLHGTCETFLCLAQLHSICSHSYCVTPKVLMAVTVVTKKTAVLWLRHHLVWYIDINISEEHALTALL